MSNNNLAGFPAFGPRVDTNITYHPRILTFDPEVELPTSAPATPQIDVAINSSDLPDMLSVWPSSLALNQRYYFIMFAYLRNDDVVQRTAYASGTVNGFYDSYCAYYVPANSYHTHTLWAGQVAFPGQNARMKLYANGAGVKLVKAIVLAVPNLRTVLHPAGITNLALELSSESLIGGTNKTSDCSYLIAHPFGAYVALTASQNLSVYLPITNYGLGYPYLYSGKYYHTSAVDDLPHPRIYYPTRIAYTPIL